MKLTAIEVKKAVPKDKPYKMADGFGLYLLVNTKGYKYWRYDYRYGVKRKTLAIGTYPDISLKQARELHKEAHSKVDHGIDPAYERKLNRLLKYEAGDSSFERVAKRWIEENKGGWSDSYTYRLETMFKRDVYPLIGDKVLSDLLASELIIVMKAVASRGAVYSAKRLKQPMGQVFAYGILHGFCERNPARDIDTKLFLPRTITNHYASITDPVKLSQLLRAIDGYQGFISVCFALKLAPHVFLRPTELTSAEWSEINLDSAVWTLPAGRRKLPTHLKRANRKKDAHIVPLSKQAVSILRELHAYTGKWKHLFLGTKTKHSPICNNAMRTALRNMGYTNEEMTPHGFRSVASTFLNTLGFRSDVIEAQLAHKEVNEVRAAYNHADYLQERISMMQDWSDYLDNLKSGADVTPLNRAG